jgi:ethanolamine ammonia-lyase small subunit
MSVNDDQGVAASPETRSLDPWAKLRRATAARIGLGRAGDTMPLRPVLDFQLAHAEARDAVHAVLDVDALAATLAPHQTIVVRSAVPDRSLYLRRPDLGRSLDPASRAPLDAAGGPFDCVFVIADGLSAVAVQRHAAPLLERCLPRLKMLSIAPIVIATQARVALGDAVGESLKARLCVMLIGERPGLSVADSLGAYITFDPKVGRRDSERNCISNIHTKGGLDYELAAQKLCWLIEQALTRGVTGIALKDDHGAPLLPGQPTA